MRRTNIMNSEFLNPNNGVDETFKTKAVEFVKTAKIIARKMSANYNQKKKAYEATLTQFNKTGSLDISRIAYHRTSDDIFMKKTIMKEGQSHGLVCAIDFSGSMSSELQQVAMQYLITALFAKYIEIPFVFYTFTTYGSIHDRVKEIPENKWPASHRETARPRFTSIADDSMNESGLINAYYHILATYTTNMYARAPGSFTNKYEAFIHKYYSMGITPILHSAYQSYLLAHAMKARGIQNVNILTISDGLNNVYFNRGVTAVQCPYTKRVYKVNEANLVYQDDALLSPMNRMTRDAGIKTFNLFIGDKLHHKREFFSMWRNFIPTHDNHNDIDNLRSRETTDKIEGELKKNGMSVIDNLHYYDKVILASTKIFPIMYNPRGGEVESEIEASNMTPRTFIKKSNEAINELAAVGKLISDIMVEDFKPRGRR